MAKLSIKVDLTQRYLTLPQPSPLQANPQDFYPTFQRLGAGEVPGYNGELFQTLVTRNHLSLTRVQPSVVYKVLPHLHVRACRPHLPRKKIEVLRAYVPCTKAQSQEMGRSEGGGDSMLEIFTLLPPILMMPEIRDSTPCSQDTSVYRRQPGLFRVLDTWTHKGLALAFPSVINRITYASFHDFPPPYELYIWE